MTSLYDEVAARLAEDPRLTKKGTARVDLNLLLFNARDDLRALWSAADASVQRGAVDDELREAVERLRPLFGERG
jgi:hypothetical protein